MLDIKLIEKKGKEIGEKLARRGKIVGLSQLFKLIKARKNLVLQLQSDQQILNIESKSLCNATSIEIGQKRTLLRTLSRCIKKNEEKQRDFNRRIQNLLLSLPNIPLDEVPAGNSEKENQEIKRVNKPRIFNFKVKDHVELGESIDGFDFKRAAKISGSRFVFLRGSMAKLNRALLNYFLEFHSNFGDEEMVPPFIVCENTMIATGHLPKFKKDVFEINHVEKPYYLIPTAEVPLTNYYAYEILDSTQLPLRLCAYSPCFRSEAGAAGKDTRGLIRQHQFEKVEMVRFVKPKQAITELNLMVERASKILSELGLAHRIVSLCAGDLGFSAQKTIDIEVWLPSQNIYKEISSCSIFGDFQARRAKIRYRKNIANKKKGKVDFVATLNGSALPLGRTLVAILENHQNIDGSVNIPKVLWPFMGGLKKLNKQII